MALFVERYGVDELLDGGEARLGVGRFAMHAPDLALVVDRREQLRRELEERLEPEPRAEALHQLAKGVDALADAMRQIAVLRRFRQDLPQRHAALHRHLDQGLDAARADAARR